MTQQPGARIYTRVLPTCGKSSTHLACMFTEAQGQAIITRTFPSILDQLSLGKQGLFLFYSCLKHSNSNLNIIIHHSNIIYSSNFTENINHDGILDCQLIGDFNPLSMGLTFLPCLQTLYTWSALVSLIRYC